jgi:hypothetical protein
VYVPHINDIDNLAQVIKRGGQSLAITHGNGHVIDMNSNHGISQGAALCHEMTHTHRVLLLHKTRTITLHYPHPI